MKKADTKKWNYVRGALTVHKQTVLNASALKKVTGLLVTFFSTDRQFNQAKACLCWIGKDPRIFYTFYKSAIFIVRRKGFSYVRRKGFSYVRRKGLSCVRCKGTLTASIYPYYTAQSSDPKKNTLLSKYSPASSSPMHPYLHNP